MLQYNPTCDDFAALLNMSCATTAMAEGSVVKGKVIAIEKDLAIIDIGLKVEGRVPLKEFSGALGLTPPDIGDTVEVYLERIENALGEAVLSREKARREEGWTRLEEAASRNERVIGTVFNQVKGGYTVDIDGTIAFLPRSQVDIRPIRDISPLIGVPQPFVIIKIDKRRGNIVVSRRAILEEDRAEQHSKLVQNLHEGQIITGVVKNITAYGAFVDLGDIDGLLHVTDMSWERGKRPEEILSIGQEVTVQIIKINPEANRVSLGMKQLEADPWQNVASKYVVGSIIQGRVTNIADYGVFVELETGVEGLVHVSEMSWTGKNIHPSKIVAAGQEVSVCVLDVEASKRRISLGLKQITPNPWEEFAKANPVGTIITGPVKNKTDFGIFVGLTPELDGMIHMSDIDWDSSKCLLSAYNKGDSVTAMVMDIDCPKERISLSIKHLTPNPEDSGNSDAK